MVVVSGRLKIEKEERTFCTSMRMSRNEMIWEVEEGKLVLRGPKVVCARRIRAFAKKGKGRPCFRRFECSIDNIVADALLGSMWYTT